MKLTAKLKNEVIIENLGEFLSRRHRVLIRRDLGGLGDILMHRMMFQTFKETAPMIDLTFACPAKFMPAVEDHPYIDHLKDAGTVVESDYAIVYNTSRTCALYELATAPNVDKHRADIWAESCGMPLSGHDMHIRFRPDELSQADEYLKTVGVRSPFAIFAPITAMASKNLDPDQCGLTARRLQDLGVSVHYLHHLPLDKFGHTLTGLSTRQFMAVISRAALVVSADTAAFHCAGGLRVPLVAVFGWADGKVYGRYFPSMTLVQKHREDDPCWTCGPCYRFTSCPKKPEIKSFRKPCITELTAEDIWGGVSRCLQKYPNILS